MKKYLISSIVAAAVLCSCAQPKQQTGYRIAGEIAGVAGKVYLTVFKGKLPRVIDSAEVKTGRSNFRATARCRFLPPSKLRTFRWCGFSSKTAR